jgi:uncharacterized membrane protein YhaH (DUF805 family)
MNYYIQALRKYADFNERARRSEYWYFVLFNLVFAITAIISDNMLHVTFSLRPGLPAVSGYVYLAYCVFLFLPSWAVLVRRLHDVGKSGWFLLVGFIPVAGAIWLLVLLFKDSQPGENKYGPNPKDIGNYTEIEQVGEYLQPQGV